VVLIFAEDLGLNLARAKGIDGCVVQQIKHRVVVDLSKGDKNSIGLIFIYGRDTSGIRYTGPVVLLASPGSWSSV